MKATVGQLMAPAVIVGEKSNTVGDVRELMEKEGVHALPIVNKAGRAVGIVTCSDVLGDEPPDMPVSEVMTAKVCTVGRQDGAHIAARLMREHKLHHLVVTDEKRVVGILSSFDLLKLVEDQGVEPQESPQASEFDCS